MRIAAMWSLACALGCGHVYPVGTTSPATDCVAVVSGGRHRPSLFFVGGRQGDFASVDAMVSGDPDARAEADRGARAMAQGLGLMAGGLATALGGWGMLVGGAGNTRWSGIAVAGSGIALEVAGSLVLAFNRHGQLALDRVNQRARDEGRCPP